MKLRIATSGVSFICTRAPEPRIAFDSGQPRVATPRPRHGFVLVTAAGTDSEVVDWPGVDHVIHADPALPAALLVRPDGYVAWATRHPPSTTELSAVRTRWCGQRAAVPCAVR